MFDVIVENGSTIVVGLVVFWFVQFGAAYWQMQRFYGRMTELRKNGLTAVGLNGDRYKGRSYAVLTINEQDRVVHAEQFSGWTVFAKLRRVPALEGIALQDMLKDEAQLPVSQKLRTAFVNAANDLQKAREKGTGTPTPEPN
ncbi:MAG: hypothetical protein GFH27_549303n12 [Chloroflexi bacterium AL-W]|nr:hypothetical protein [Chloroflexi bacterium AL-N1]NOK67896.1 hypothetical protein [Chloroflexi bacterium AL-N10]NOK73236.1 hypothetical protein [Chloroflexi bacterium AL-N5]NOK83151.1 hypothetical protein [Chloroflexi bacterium AL-W]